MQIFIVHYHIIFRRNYIIMLRYRIIQLIQNIISNILFLLKLEYILDSSLLLLLFD